jgi:hypothetical protein
MWLFESSKAPNWMIFFMIPMMGIMLFMNGYRGPHRKIVLLALLSVAAILGVIAYLTRKKRR